MQKIMLTQGLETIVDDSDFEWLNRWNWHAKRSNTRIYAARAARTKERIEFNVSPQIRMHRFIMGNPPLPIEIDHINGNSLDNRRENLRLITRADHNRLRKSRHTIISKRGPIHIHYLNKKRKWRAIWNVGYYETQAEAALVVEQINLMISNVNIPIAFNNYCKTRTLPDLGCCDVHDVNRGRSKRPPRYPEEDF